MSAVGGRARAWLPVLAACLAFAALCLGGVTTSSLGALRQGADSAGIHQLGQPEQIRADEYMTETPIALGWIAAGGHDIDNPLSVEPNYFAQLPSGPVSMLVFFDGTIAQLGPWLPDAMLFAARWWLPTLLLFLGLPAWFKQITGSRRWGYVAAVLVYFAPANAWWSGRPVNTLGFMFASAALMLHAQDRFARRQWRIAALEVALAAVLMARLPSYYQPFAIVLGFPVLLGTLAFLLRRPGPWRPKWITIGATGGLAAALTGATMLENAAAIRSGLGTVYPGDRRSTGASWFFGKVFGAPALGTLEHVQDTLVATNASETSSAFLVLFLVAGVLWVAGPWRDTSASLLNWLVWMGLSAAWVAWCTVDFGTIGTHLPIVNLVPSFRAANVVGFLGTVAFCLFMAQWRTRSLKPALLAALLAAGVTLYAGSSLRANGLPELRVSVVLSSGLLTGLVVFGVVRWPTRRLSLIALSGAAALTTALVNPVVVGLGQLRGGTTAEAMVSAGRDSREADELWASDTAAFDSLMFATATPALSSRQQIGPDDEEWLELDPTGAHREIWNRGGSYIRFEWTTSRTIAWSNPVTDQIVMAASPCTVAALQPRLRHVVSTQERTDPCLTLDQTLEWMGQTQFVYQVDGARAAT